MDKAVRLAVDLGSPYAEEFRIIRPDGSYRWCLSRGQAFRDLKGRPVRMSGIDVDVSDRKHWEEQFRRSEERHRTATEVVSESDLATDRNERSSELLNVYENRFRKLADSDIIGVIFGDVHGGISYANDEYLRIIGYSREEFESGRIGWAAVTPPEWLPVDEQAIASAKEPAGHAIPTRRSMSGRTAIASPSWSVSRSSGTRRPSLSSSTSPSGNGPSERSGG